MQLVVRHLSSDGEAEIWARIMATNDRWLTLRRGRGLGHSEWLPRKSIAPLADWTTSRSPLAFDPRRVSP